MKQHVIIEDRNATVYRIPGWKQPCFSFLLNRKVKKLVQRNLQSLGNLVDHAGSYVVFTPFNSPDLLTGISNKKTKVFLGHIFSQSQLSHPVSKGIQKIFVYYILHIQEWRFIKNQKSPYMGYFMFLTIFGSGRATFKT